MKLYRIYAMILRHFYIFKRSPDRMSEAFFWPLVDILVWGVTSLYFANASHTPHIVWFILSGIIFWTVIYRGQQEISMNLLEELWNKNLVNIFTTPLTFWEWMVTIVAVSLIKTCLSFLFISFLSFLLYKMNVFLYGFYLIPSLFLLILFAWSVGFFVVGLILRYSTKVQTIAWSLVAAFSPFFGMYYSLSILPIWAQKIALLMPPSYIFEGMREIIQKGSMDSQKLIISFGISLVYLIASIIYLKLSFNKVLEKGLVKVY